MAFGVTAVVSAGSALVSAGVGIAGGIMSSNAQRTAAANNAYLSQKEADATLAVSTYQNNLNKAVALSNASVADQNANVYHSAARTTENLGFEQETRDLMNQDMQQSGVRAEYGASGVQGDTGSPLSVAEHQGYVAQLHRMDTAYQTNVAAMDKDWQGALSTYQASLDRELATQYDYANQMAQWQHIAAYAGAAVQQQTADSQATAALIGQVGQTIGQVGSAFENYGMASYRASSYGAGAIGGGYYQPGMSVLVPNR